MQMKHEKKQHVEPTDFDLVDLEDARLPDSNEMSECAV